MENQWGFVEAFRGFVRLSKAVFTSFSAPENRGISGIAGIGGIFCGLHIVDTEFSYFLLKYALALKIIGSFFTVVIAPPLGVFMKDVYELKVKPNIKFLNKK